MKKIDIVDIKKQAKDGVISFYLQNNRIYCKDMRSLEVVFVGDSMYVENNNSAYQGVLDAIANSPR